MDQKLLLQVWEGRTSINTNYSLMFAKIPGFFQWFLPLRAICQIALEATSLGTGPTVDVTRLLSHLRALGSRPHLLPSALPGAEASVKVGCGRSHHVVNSMVISWVGEANINQQQSSIHRKYDWISLLDVISLVGGW